MTILPDITSAKTPFLFSFMQIMIGHFPKNQAIKRKSS